jgi:hypothetical protein
MEIYTNLEELGDNIIKPLSLFVCTQSAKITNFNYTMEDFTKILKDNLPDFILALNTNYGHICQEGCESELKLNSRNSNTSNLLRFVNSIPVKG